jgi:hypothetical protein
MVSSPCRHSTRKGCHTAREAAPVGSVSRGRLCEKNSSWGKDRDRYRGCEPGTPMCELLYILPLFFFTKFMPILALAVPHRRTALSPHESDARRAFTEPRRIDPQPPQPDIGVCIDMDQTMRTSSPCVRITPGVRLPFRIVACSPPQRGKKWLLPSCPGLLPCALVAAGLLPGVPLAYFEGPLTVPCRLILSSATELGACRLELTP